MIDTREELIRALQEAAEIEQGLMIQYLFGAFSLKRRVEERLSHPQAAAVREWAGTILRVAQEEMGHLGTVCNLLSAVGAPPHFDRPNFPKASGYYPFPFDLVPFDDDFLFRILVFELPRNAPLPPRHLCPGAPPARTAALAADAVVPDPIVFERVGELYAKIAAGFRAIPERQLFIGPLAAQDDGSWSINLDLRRVQDRASTVRAIDDIIEDGEGTHIDTPGSHFARFSRMRDAYVKQGCFEAARAVVTNPATIRRRDSDGPVTLIENPETAEIARLFNGIYYVVLTLLLHYFAKGGEGPAARVAIKTAAARTMSVAIRPIAEILTERPVADAADLRRAGPCFELAGPMFLPPTVESRWTMTLERFDAIVAEAKRLAAIAPRLATIAETMAFIRRDLARAARED